MGTFIRLVDFGTAEKEIEFFNTDNYYVFDIREDNRVPSSPVVYQASEKMLEIFESGNLLGNMAVVRNGMKTGANDVFIRLWWEVCDKKSFYHALNSTEAIQSGRKWFPYNKGGSARRWYGNNDYVVNWEEGGKIVIGKAKEEKRHVQDYPDEMKFENSVTWSLINTKAPTFRLKSGSISDIAGMSFYRAQKNTLYLLALCNSVISTELLQMIAPTMNYQAGDIARIPVSVDENRREEIEKITMRCIEISKTEWDSAEISWDFMKSPLIRNVNTIQTAYTEYVRDCDGANAEIKELEDRIDDLFLDIYGLSKKGFSEERFIRSSLYQQDLLTQVKQFISYAVGCVMGRYSLRKDGLVFAGGTWDESVYSDNFKPCEYGVMPITEEQFFEEDLCTRVIDFIRIVYGENSLNENLKYVASALKPDLYDAPKKILREYLFNDFFDDHFQLYQHRPIYWQLDSGKNGGFRALMYMHRFDENVLPLVRTEYIQDIRYKYEEEMQRLKSKQESASTTAEKNAIKKDIAALDKKIVECTAYDELLNHATSSIQNYLFDLDDGVKTNYAKFLSIDGDKNSNILTVVKL